MRGIVYWWGSERNAMHGLSMMLQFALASVLILVSLLSTQLLLLAVIRILVPRVRLAAPALAEDDLPHVVVQLPVCEEGALAVRVAAAAARLNWPADRLHIQLLDDGAEHNHEGLARALMSVVPAGIDFQILRRGDRKGFKAGNLAHGLLHSDAPYVAIFDADFVPPTDFLRRTIPPLVADTGLAFVQTRWGHANRERNWLTRVQGVLLDAHFAVEQDARFRAGLPMSFNGTAGVWRREAIDNGGGWSGDTLTEDLDLAMRCAMKGWRGALMPEIEVPGELPETAAAWRAQQARWTKGHAQTARKLLPMIWTSDMPLWKKAAMSLQMCQFAFYLLAAASVGISLMLTYGGFVYIESVAALGLWVSGLGLFTTLSYLFIGQAVLGRGADKYLLPSMVLGIVFPSGLVLSNSLATYEAFFSTNMDFNRTQRAGEAYVGRWRGGPELLVGVMLPAVTFAEQQNWSAPFCVFAVAGLVSIGAMGLSSSAAPARAREIAPGE